METKTESKNKWVGAGLLAAITASLCCITPVLAVLGGLGGIASTFAFLDPLRPYLIGSTAIILGYAFYNAYKPKKEDDLECACEDEESLAKKNFLNSKAFLWIVERRSSRISPWISRMLRSRHRPREAGRETSAAAAPGSTASAPRNAKILATTCSGFSQRSSMRTGR